MEVKDVGGIIDRVWIQTQFDFGYVEKFPLLFRGCMGNLVVVDGNVNQYSYIDLMGENLQESVEQMFSDQQHLFVLQQDNAFCHRAMAM